MTGGKRVAVVGANGFVGQHVCWHLSKKAVVTPVTRQTLDLHNAEHVRSFLKNGQFDVVILATMSYGDQSNVYDAWNLLGSFVNFYHNSDLFGRLINLGSGAELDRSRDINLATEAQLFDHMPKDSYGFGLNIKARMCHERDNFYNLRIFGCFGHSEKDTRLFKRFLASDTFYLDNDRYCDYTSIQDLYRIIEYYVFANDDMPADVNCVYKDKFKISDILTKFIEINNLTNRFEIRSVCDNNYTGSSDMLSQLPIELLGLEHGIKHYSPS